MKKEFPQAVFLDRDGVINEEDGIIRRADQLRLIPGSAAAIARLNAVGILVIVVTNQPVVARGWCTEKEVDAIHHHLRSLLEAEGATLDAIYSCPHHEDADDLVYRVVCECRKPRPGMLWRAAADHSLDLSRCLLIGDRTVDIAAGRATGCLAILVRTGFGGSDGKCPDVPDAIMPDLAAAVEWLLNPSPGVTCPDRECGDPGDRPSHP